MTYNCKKSYFSKVADVYEQLTSFAVFFKDFFRSIFRASLYICFWLFITVPRFDSSSLLKFSNRKKSRCKHCVILIIFKPHLSTGTRWWTLEERLRISGDEWLYSAIVQQWRLEVVKYCREELSFIWSEISWSISSHKTQFKCSLLIHKNYLFPRLITLFIFFTLLLIATKAWYRSVWS